MEVDYFCRICKEPIDCSYMTDCRCVLCGKLYCATHISNLNEAIAAYVFDSDWNVCTLCSSPDNRLFSTALQLGRQQEKIDMLANALTKEMPGVYR